MTDSFGATLRAWRRANLLKQEVLAARLGVSQSAISNWERGHDTPSLAAMKRLRDLMASATRDDLAIERLAISRQRDVRFIADLDRVRLLAVSQGYRALWPSFSAELGRAFRDHLVGETRIFVEDPEIRAGVWSGDIVFASGVTDEHTDVPLDAAVRHRWLMTVRTFGPMVYADIIEEPCAPDTPTGLHEIIRLDDLVR